MEADRDSSSWAGLSERFSVFPVGEPIRSISILPRASVLGRGLVIGEETRLEAEGVATFGEFDRTTARARRSWRRSFLRALEELRERSAIDSVSMRRRRIAPCQIGISRTASRVCIRTCRPGLQLRAFIFFGQDQIQSRFHAGDGLLEKRSDLPFRLGALGILRHDGLGGRDDGRNA